MTNLQLRRIAAHALNTLLRDNYHLNQIAYTFHSDNIWEWEIPSDWEATALINNREAAYTWVEGNEVGIRINDIYNIIRTEHIGEFNPELYNIQVDTREDILGDPDKYPDIHDIMPLVKPPNYDMPEKPIQRHVGGRRPKVVASL